MTLISADISMHPIANEFVEPIHRFIELLQHTSGIEVESGPISTQIYGEHSTVISAISNAMEDAFTHQQQLTVFSLRIASGDARALQTQHPMPAD